MTKSQQAPGGRAALFRRQDLVSLSEAARRTGLSDSGSAMARECSRRELGVVCGSGGQVLVDLGSFSGTQADVELGEVVVLELGRL